MIVIESYLYQKENYFMMMNMYVETVGLISHSNQLINHESLSVVYCYHERIKATLLMEEQYLDTQSLTATP
jgi:hypothetical protein